MWGNINNSILVGPEDQEFVNKYDWYFSVPRKYVIATIDGKQQYLHQILLKTELTVDHKNGNKLDNRKENLREATYSQQNHNRPITIANTSGYKGVVWHKQKKMWMAQIRTEEKTIFLGYFYSIIAAAREYDKAAINIYKEFANINGA